jgi:hypothetical protein
VKAIAPAGMALRGTKLGSEVKGEHRRMVIIEGERLAPCWALPLGAPTQNLIPMVTGVRTIETGYSVTHVARPFDGVLVYLNPNGRAG